MPLPNTSMSFSPFAILTAEEMNDLVENIESLSDGSGLEDGSVTAPKAAAGFAVQVGSFQSGAAATGTTLIPIDNTIPQITEGTEFMTLSFTPKSATNVLVIEADINGSLSVQGNTMMALFKDATASALASNVTLTAANFFTKYSLRHKMVAGTTSAITFRIRAGGDVSSTMSFNSVTGVQYMGGTLASNITVTEYKG